ncbi:MAG: bifunctional metallophosphatase/5'-nucleotidase [Actinotalea sp.]|nr:bifunctional metallophosphatase/5'-nucleotidase [Actinotalea sp.]
MHPSRRPTGRLVPLAAAGAMTASLLVAAPAAADSHGVEIDIFGINDFHGRIEASGAVAGAAVLSGYINERRLENPNTLFVSAGDNIGASTFTSFVADDVPTLDVLNAMDLDVSALGNHEFDLGRADLDDRVIPYAEFPYLAANIYDRTTGDRAYDASHVIEVDGVRVGFIGANTEELPSLVSPTGIASLEVRSIVDEVNDVATELVDGGAADVVVLLVHEGPATGTLEAMRSDATFGAIINGLNEHVDAVFSGHTHRQFAHLVSRPDDLALPVVQAGQYGEAIARVSFTVDPATKDVLDVAAAVTPLAGAATADPAVASIVAAAVAEAEVLGAVPLGEITADFLRGTQPDVDDDGNPITVENRGAETTLGNLVADVQLWATQDLGTELAFMNPGGLRANLLYGEDGIITYRQAANVQPFANTLVVMTLTGQQILDVLEEQWQPDGASRPFLKLGVAGATYTYDPTAPRGERITEVWVGDEELDVAGTYRVVVNSFLAGGGDNFGTLAAGTDRADSGRVDLQAFVDFMASESPVSPDLAQRAVGVVLETPEGGFEVGDEVTVALSSLLFSNAAGQATEVVLSVDGEEIARAELDQEVVPSFDEFGSALVTFTVPESLAGATNVVEVTVPGNGTAVWFGLTVAAAPVTPPGPPVTPPVTPPGPPTVTPPGPPATPPGPPATPARPVTAKPTYAG